MLVYKSTTFVWDPATFPTFLQPPKAAAGPTASHTHRHWQRPRQPGPGRRAEAAQHGASVVRAGRQGSCGVCVFWGVESHESRGIKMFILTRVAFDGNSCSSFLWL